MDYMSIFLARSRLYISLTWRYMSFGEVTCSLSKCCVNDCSNSQVICSPSLLNCAYGVITDCRALETDLSIIDCNVPVDDTLPN
jgi:hypothetical protein